MAGLHYTMAGLLSVILHRVYETCIARVTLYVSASFNSLSYLIDSGLRERQASTEVTYRTASLEAPSQGPFDTFQTRMRVQLQMHVDPYH